MANNILANIKVNVTSDGFQLIDIGTKKAKKGLDGVDKSQKKAKKSGNDFHKQQKSLYQSNLAGSKSFSKMAQTIGTDGGGGSSTLVSAYATLAANVFAATAAFGALSRAAEFTKLREGLEIIGAQSGRTLSVLADDLRDATGGALSLEQASSAAALGISGGFGAKELQGLADIAKGAALTLGRSLPDAFDRLTRGAIKLEPEILDELGIMVRLDDAVETYAAQLNKSSGALTQMERRQAFMNAILEQGAAKFGEISKQADPTAYQKLGATFADLTKDIFNFVNKTLFLESVVGFLANSTTSLFGVMLLFGSTIVGTMIPALTGFASKAADVAENAFEMADSMAEFAKSQTAVARGQVGAFGLGTKNFQTFQASIAAGTNSTKDLDKALLSLKRSESLRSKNLLAGSVKNKAAKEAELALIKEQILLIEQLQAAETKQDVFSLAAKNAKINAQFLTKNAEVLEQVSTGEIGLFAALSANSKALGERSKQLSEGAVKTTIFAKANTKVGNAFKYVTSQLKIVLSAFLKFLPIIAAVTIAIGIALIIFDKVFNTEKAKAYRKEVKKLDEILGALGDKAEEYTKALNDGLPVTTAQIRQFQILSNTAQEINDQLEETIKKRKELSKERGGEDEVTRGNFSIDLMNFEAAEIDYLPGLEASKEQIKIFEESFKNMIGTSLPDTASKTSNELKEILGNAVDIAGTEEIRTLRNLFENEIPQYGEFIRQNLSFGKLLSGDLEGFRDHVASLTKTMSVFFKGVGEAVTGVQNSMKDAEKIGSQFMQKFLPKTNTTDLIASLRLIENGLVAVQEETEKVSKYNTLESFIRANEEVGKSFMNVGSSVADLFGGEFIEAQNKALKSQNELNKLKKDETPDILQKKKIREAERQLERDLIALGQVGNTQLENSLDTLVKLNNAELLRKETQAQINKLKVVEKAILGKSASSGVIANLALTETLTLRKEEAHLTNQILGNKLGLTELEMEESVIIDNLVAKQKELEASGANDQEIQAIKLRVLEAQGIALQEALDAAQITFNTENATLAVRKEALKLTERQEALTQKNNAFANKTAGQALGRKGASGVSNLFEQIRIEEEKVKIAKEKAEIEKKSVNIQATLLKAQIKAYEQAGFITPIDATNIINDIETNLQKLTGPDGIISKEVEAVTNNTVDVLQDKFSEVFGKDFTSSLSNSLDLSIMSSAGTLDTFNEQMLASASLVTRFGEIMGDTFGESGAAVQSLASFAGVIAEIGPSIKQQFSEINEAQKGEDGITGAQANALKFAAVADSIGSVVGALSQSLAAYSQSKIALIDQAIEKEKALDGKSEQSVNKIKALEKKKEAIQRKAFETNKKMQIAQAVISTASAMAQTYAALADMFPLNIIAAAAIGALGLAQIAMIKKTQFTGGSSEAPAAPSTALSIGGRSNAVDVSQKATGGELNYLRGGSTEGTNLGGAGGAMGRKGYANGGEGIVVGERGPEIITPADPVDITPNFALGGETNVNFTINAVDAAGVEDLLTNQRGNIIRMIREAANENGEDFLTQVDPMAYGSKS